MRHIHPLIFLLLSPITALSVSGQAYLGASIAASFASLSDSSPDITYDGGLLNDSYPLDNNTTVAPVLSINAGYEFAGQGTVPAISLGLGIYSTVPDYNFQGDVIETAKGDPSFELYDYSYDISVTQVMIESQFIWEYHEFLPFIHVGLGAAWINMKNYSEDPSLVPPFYSNTLTNFAYQAGVGVAKTFGHERIALAYRFTGLGETDFGTRGPIYPYSLNTGNLYTNDLYFAYTHLF